MDGRWIRLLASSLMLGSVGCGSLWGKKPAMFEPPTTAAKPVERRAKDEGPIKLETLLAVGEVRLQAAAGPERTERERDANIESARAAYQQVLKRDPKNIDAMLGMARSYKIAQDKDLCVEWYQRATKASPTSASIWGEMGQSIDGLKDRDLAISCYHTATKLDPANKDYRKALGFALARVGRYEEAEAWLTRCMSPADAHVCLARMMDHNGQRELANKHFTLALESDPSNERARLALSNAVAPNDNMATGVKTVNYEQYAPASGTPGFDSNPRSSTASQPGNPAPGTWNQNGAPSPVAAPPQGWIQPR